MGEKHKQKLASDPTSGSDLGSWEPELMGKVFLKRNLFTPLLYDPNDQRVMGIILRYVCWGTHRPPWGARRLTGRPTYPPHPSIPCKLQYFAKIFNSRVFFF